MEINSDPTTNDNGTGHRTPSWSDKNRASKTRGTDADRKAADGRTVGKPDLRARSDEVIGIPAADQGASQGGSCCPGAFSNCTD